MINRWTLLAGVLLILSLSAVACVQIGPALLPRLSGSDGGDEIDAASADNQTAPITVATPSARASSVGLQTATVRRGSIAQALPLTGRVVGAEQFPVNFPGVGKVESVPVKVGDAVAEGQTLVQTSAADVQKSLDAAQTNLENDQIRLEQGAAQAAAQETARQRDAASRQQDAVKQQQAAVADAQAALAAAQAAQQKVLAGPSDSDRRSAEIGLSTAHANVQRAQADLDRLNRPADPADVRTAQHDVDTAQTAVNQSQAALSRLNAGPDPDALSTAQRDVQRAQNALTVAQADKSTTGAAHDAAVANAKLTLQDAQDRVTRLQAPPNPDDVNTAKLNVQAAQATLDNAKARLASLNQGAGQDSIDNAQAALDAAQKTEQNAQALLDNLNSHPTPAEVQDAAQKVQAAQAVVNRAKNQTMPTTSAPDASSPYNLLLLQKAVEQDQAEIDKLQTGLATTKLVAPFDGTVADVSIKVGDLVDVNQQVIVLVKPGDPIVRVDVADKDAAQLSPGQAATAKPDTAPDGAAPFQGSLAALSNAASGPGKVAQLKMDWAGNTPLLGTTVQVQVTIQKKDDVLLVPKKAIRTAGDRQYVQYQDGPSRKAATVKVGLVVGDDAEIVSGLTEGQVVLVGL